MELDHSATRSTTHEAQMYCGSLLSYIGLTLKRQFAPLCTPTMHACRSPLNTDTGEFSRFARRPPDVVGVVLARAG